MFSAGRHRREKQMKDIKKFDLGEQVLFKGKYLFISAFFYTRDDKGKYLPKIGLSKDLHEKGIQKYKYIVTVEDLFKEKSDEEKEIKEAIKTLKKYGIEIK